MSISELTVEVGAEREHTITLTRTNPSTGAVETITADSLESATLKIGDLICLDTDEGSLEFNDDETAVVAKLGLIEGLEAYTTYECYLTIYDAGSPTGGLPWARIAITTVPWEHCS